MGLQINIEFDSNALAAPASFRIAVQAAANVLEAAINNPITVNIDVGYGEYDLGGPSYMPLTGNSLGGVNSGIPVSYSLLRAALLEKATTPAEIAAINALPNTVALNGQSQFYVSFAQAKALGAISATSTATDGYAGFPTSYTGALLTTAAIVELAHAMGLLGGQFPLSLFEYTGPGTHYFSDGTTNTPVFFSLDGGNTVFAYYDASFDPTLFQNVPNDPLSIPDTHATTLTPLDLSELGAIGFDVNDLATPQSPTIAPIANTSGAAPVVGVGNVSVRENAIISAASLIKSVSAPTGDSIAYYGFYDAGNGSGHFSINGVVEPDKQWINVLSTQLGAFEYVGGPTAGNEALEVYAFDYTSDTNSSVAALAATTTSPPNSDFNGDGTSDILARQSTGTLRVYDMQAGSVNGYQELGALGNDWTIAGVGDFNGDGTSDILARQGTGALRVYDMQAGRVSSYQELGALGNDWTIVGADDFNGDGTSDILARQGTGALRVYDMQAGSVNGYQELGALGNDWTIVGVGDFNGDGTSDILARQGTGALRVYDMQAGRVSSYQELGALGNDWLII